jgi:hypothetical protein
MTRLPDSQRNSLIEDFRKGVVTPDYDIIPNKNIKGKYTVRGRKVTLPVKEGEELPKEGEEPKPTTEEDPLILQEQPQVITDETYNPFDDGELYLPPGAMKTGEVFREMQLQLNRVFLENMKMMRKDLKYQKLKHDKYKQKTKKIYDIINQVASRSEYDDEEQSYTEPKEHLEEPKEEDPKDTEEEFTVYDNSYEKKLDYMTGDSRPTYSRRSKLKAFI